MQPSDKILYPFNLFRNQDSGKKNHHIQETDKEEPGTHHPIAIEIQGDFVIKKKEKNRKEGTLHFSQKEFVVDDMQSF